MAGSEQGLYMVMARLKNESWESQQQVLQCMLLGAKKIPCRVDDIDDLRGPRKQGYQPPPDPKHMAKDKLPHQVQNAEDDFRPYDEAEARRLMNGYEVSTHQSEIIPRQLLPAWEPPDNHGKPVHEQETDWKLGRRLTLVASGLDDAHYTELSGRHYKETARSTYLQLKAAGGHDSFKPSHHSTSPFASSSAHLSGSVLDEVWLDAAAAGTAQELDDALEEPQAKRNLRKGQMVSAFAARDPRLKGHATESALKPQVVVPEAKAKRAGAQAAANRGRSEAELSSTAHRASLRTLRHRKSLATSASSLHHLQSMRIPDSEIATRFDTGESNHLDPQERAGAENEPTVNSLNPVRDEQQGNAVRGVLPLINRKSLMSNNLQASR